MSVVADSALDAFADAVGEDAVLRADEQLREFRDPYTFAGWGRGTASAVVFPSSVEQVQAVVRIADEHRVPLWTSSQGRNNAYGGAAPRVDGSVLVSLRRMNRVLEIDERLAYALVEPGVSFFDLAEAVRSGGYKLLVSVPVLGWGSVVGNTLEYGWGYTPYGDHASAQCGMEVVLASGDVIRTGMGAMEGNRSWQTYRRGYGPSADGLFFQSNLGIVTKMGVWLLPRPEVYAPCYLSAGEDDGDLELLVDTLRPLVLDRTIQNVPLLMKDPFSGRWGVRFALYGHEAVVDAQLAHLERAFGRIPGAELSSHKLPGDGAAVCENPLEQVMGGVPGLAALEVVKLQAGEHGGQLDFSPVTPLTGRDAVGLCNLLRPLYAAAGFPFGPGIIVTPRGLIFTSHMAFDTTDEERVRAAFDLYPRLAAAAADAGYGIYRTHLEFMDLAASQFDFNDHALRRFNETLKDALDPNGILSPGKSGIWPRRMRAG